MTPKNRRSKLHDIQQIADSLRSDALTSADGVGLPDFTDAIMQRVHAERPFLTHRTRRLVVACRYGAAAAAVLAVGGIVLVQATSPKITQLAAPMQPVTFSPTVDAVRATTAQAVNSVRRGIQEFNTLTDSARHITVVLNCVEQPASVETCSMSLQAVSETDVPSRQVRYVLTTYPMSDSGAADAGNDGAYFTGAIGMTGTTSSRLSTLKRPRVVYLVEPYSLRPTSAPPCSILGGFAPVLTGQLVEDEFLPQ